MNDSVPIFLLSNDDLDNNFAEIRAINCIKTLENETRERKKAILIFIIAFLLLLDFV